MSTCRENWTGLLWHARSKKLSDTRIIFITSCCDKNTLDRAKEVDPDGHILKPFNETNIRVALKLLD